jgi:protein ImuB
LQQQLRDQLWQPLAGRLPASVFAETHCFTEPVDNAACLALVCQPLLSSLTAQLVRHDLAAAMVELDLTLDNRETVADAIRPASPTRDSAQLHDLVCRRLEALALSCGVMELRLTIEPVPLAVEQLQLFSENPGRSLRDANAALARLRARYGDDAVAHAALRDHHLPEAAFAWQPLQKVRLPTPMPTARRPLVRRIYHRPQSVAAFVAATSRRRPAASESARQNEASDPGQALAALGGIVGTDGPYLISGGWWQGSVHREYHHLQMAAGQVVWVFYDRRRRRWFVHGRVE